MSTFTYGQPQIYADMPADAPAEEPANVDAEQPPRARGLRRSRSGICIRSFFLLTVINHLQDAIHVAYDERSVTRAVRLAQRAASSV